VIAEHICKCVVCLTPADAETLLMARIEELRYHIRVESAVQEGAEKAIKLLKNFKSVDKKPLQEVWNNCSLFMLCVYRGFWHWCQRACMNRVMFIHEVVHGM